MQRRDLGPRRPREDRFRPDFGRSCNAQERPFPTDLKRSGGAQRPSGGPGSLTHGVRQTRVCETRPMDAKPCALCPCSVLFAISQTESRNGARLQDIRRRIVGCGGSWVAETSGTQSSGATGFWQPSNQRGRTFKERFRPEVRQTMDCGVRRRSRSEKDQCSNRRCARDCTPFDWNKITYLPAFLPCPAELEPASV